MSEKTKIAVQIFIEKKQTAIVSSKYRINNITTDFNIFDMSKVFDKKTQSKIWRSMSAFGDNACGNFIVNDVEFAK